MSIDKRITHRRNFAGGADMGTVDAKDASGNVTRSANTKISGGYQGGTPGGSGQGNPNRDDNRPVNYERGRRQFIQKLNNDNAIRANQTGTKFKSYKDPGRNQSGGFGLQNLIGLALGIPMPGMFKSFRSGITSLNDKLGDFREKTTGYRTQEEYDNARQQRINLKRINTIQNTLNRKYSDGDYSNTDLDERLAALKSQMGIVPNTAEQNAQQFLDFGNELAENTQQTIFPAPTIEPNAQGYLYPTEGIAGVQFPEQTSGVQFPEQTSKAEIESALGPGFRPSRDNLFEQVFPQRQLYPFADY